MVALGATKNSNLSIAIGSLGASMPHFAAAKAGRHIRRSGLQQTLQHDPLADAAMRRGSTLAPESLG